MHFHTKFPALNVVFMASLAEEQSIESGKRPKLRRLTPTVPFVCLIQTMLVASWHIPTDFTFLQMLVGIFLHRERARHWILFSECCFYGELGREAEHREREAYKAEPVNSDCPLCLHDKDVG